MNLELDLESMRAKNWRQLIRPKGVSVVEESENYARFVAEPLERGYGHTLGASIKEALLTTIRGSAVIAYKLKGKVNEGKEHLAMNLKGGSAAELEAQPTREAKLRYWHTHCSSNFDARAIRMLCHFSRKHWCI